MKTLVPLGLILLMASADVMAGVQASSAQVVIRQYAPIAPPTPYPEVMGGTDVGPVQAPMSPQVFPEPPSSPEAAAPVSGGALLLRRSHGHRHRTRR